MYHKEKYKGEHKPMEVSLLEMLEARERQNRLTQELKLLLLPKDPDDGRSVASYR